MRAPLGRLVALAMILAGLGTASVARAEAADAVAGDKPTAIGLAKNGTTYVGFSTGGKLQRINSGGKLHGSVPLDQDEAVDGLDVAANGDIWVDYETGVSLLSPSGHVRMHFDHDPLRTCDSSTPATRYGGIAVADNRIYVANRCANSLSVYARNGDLLTTVGLPGRPRGVAYGVAQAGRPAFVYVALPDRGQVLSFKASSLRGSSSPASRYTLKRPRGGARPEPGGVVVDRHGQLTVTDMANNALYLVNTNYRYSLYRTLGHPPHASRAVGRLNSPGALAQHDQDGGGLSGNYFVLDTDNTRVQRWSTGGYSYWSRGVRAGAGGDDDGGGGGGGAPANVASPSISGTAVVGNTLSCSSGSWTGAKPINYAYTWNRDGAAISGAGTSIYTVSSDDSGARLSCTVRATNAKGSAQATSASVTVGGGGGGDGPTNQVPPVISGTPAVGQVLTCSTGFWSGGGPSDPIVYTYQWRRAGAPIAGETTATHTVVAADSGTALTCTVTAASSGGSASATSAAVTVGGSGTAPTNVSPPTISGTASPGETLTCNPGTWSGSGISYSYAWRRGVTDAGSGPTYTVLSSDVGLSLTCVVTATSAGGTASAPSAAVTVSGPSGHAPANTAPPVISGTPAVGQTLTCSNGTWTGAPTSFQYVWRRNGAAISGATASTYVVVAGDAGASLVCTVVATNGSGDGAASSAPVVVSDGSPPVNTATPTVSGTGAVATALTCAPGTWTGGGISYHYVWNRNGTPVADTDSDKYVVLSADQGASMSCTVTASNGAGTAAATSGGKTVPAVPGGSPTVTTPPSISGTTGTGQTLTCAVGTWTGSPTSYTVVWQRDGATIGTGTTYVQVAADQDHALRCLVVASNAAGKGAARSEAVGGSTGCSGEVGVLINGGAAETTNPAVQLTIRAPAGATTVAVSNHASMAGATVFPLAGGCTVPWTMDSIPGLPLTWSVYVQFDNDATTYSDAIVVNQPAARLSLW
ncbi:hypothetical protein [Nocardioides sp.]|uniref:hypothetical protein n=1 Tax=Nocardioides sp. TaxID=35761 RepID=UPI0037832CBC